MALLDKVLKTYNTVSKMPALLSAEITSNGTALKSIWSQRDVEKGKTTKILRVHTLNSDGKNAQSICSVNITEELLRCSSKTGNLIGIIRENDSKQFLEIWSQDELKATVDLKSLDLHGDVYADDEFARLQFSPDETKLLYIAEKKQPKTEPFWKRNQVKPNGKDDEIIKGQEYLYREDWGDQFVNKVQSVIVQYDLNKDEVEILSGIPENVFPAKPSYSPDGTHIIGIAYKTHPRKFGLIYCTNRLSTVFKLDFEGNYSKLRLWLCNIICVDRVGFLAEINLKNKSAKDPRYTPDGKTIIWLQREAGGTHAACMSLVKTAAPLKENSEIDVVIDIVQRETTTANNKLFYGLYNTNFPENCWTNDGKLVLTTNQKNTLQSYMIDLDKKSINQFGEISDSFTILGVFDDVLIFNHSNIFKSDTLTLGKLENDIASIEWIEVTPRSRIPGLENHVCDYVELFHNTDDDVKSFTIIYIGPQTETKASVPLIVWPHGGPHSFSTNNLSLEAALFLKLGYAVILVNYRGSTGAGQATIDFSPHRVGVCDVADCVLAVETTLAKYPYLNKDAVVLFGSSYGGFLVTHLSGQYPDMFKVVITKNPVIDIAAMSIMSDIPDWCSVVIGSQYTQIGEPNIQNLISMRLLSPIQHAYKVKAPTMIQVGSVDLRVPPTQSKEYYTRLKANGVPVIMHLYNDNHSIGSILNEVDYLINTILFIEEHIKAN
ncbi:serine peptidase s9 family member [Holotrichia oblita]|uniref:Serine peptidase s9 family member n=1 Tax=Holotrichia oblita TaxID=644536 RepID=A0ACB9T1M0_HOLOL|nr:serine peptidase s9 family member [Holotrichia oblita]